MMDLEAPYLEAMRRVMQAGALAAIVAETEVRENGGDRAQYADAFMRELRRIMQHDASPQRA